MAALTEVRVPDIGDFKDIDVIEVLVAPGDAVTAEQSLITLESDKATMEIPPAAGVIRELKVKLGDKVSEGSLVAARAAGQVASAAGTAPAADAGTAPHWRQSLPPRNRRLRQSLRPCRMYGPYRGSRARKSFQSPTRALRFAGSRASSASTCKKWKGTARRGAS